MKKRKRKSLDLVRIAAVLVIIGAVVYFYYNLFAPVSIPRPIRLGLLQKPYTILILGQDITYNAETHKPMPQLKGRADTILLTRIDPIRQRVTVLSVPRDTYLMLPGYGMRKINVANAIGGVELVKDSVSKLTNQEIDYYLEIKPNVVSKLVDLLGGVYLYVDRDMRYKDRVQGLDINLKKGWQKLDGKHAHDFIRFRTTFRGDIGRIERQQVFLKALMQAMAKPSNVIKAPVAIKTAMEYIDTDMPLSEILRTLNWARMLPDGSIRTELLPGDVTMEAGAGSIWKTSPEGIAELTNELF
ncbi:MAG: LCP family protein [Candidatus Margulisbacteria bacterium]|nr:LCP family protein [Candidatus Margulisiibacteriota bacterium]